MTKTRLNRAGAVVAAAVALALLGAACSSSSSTPPASSSSSSSGSTSAGTSAQVSAAQQYVAKAQQAPTTIGVTTPLKTAPPKGKTFVWMQCDVSQCPVITPSIAAATAAIGWNLKVISYQSANPATLVAGMKQALQYKPVAVALSGLPEAVWATEIPAYKAAGVPIIVAYVGPQQISFPVIANIGGPPDISQNGRFIANWFIANSNGKGRALLYNVNDFPILKTFSDTVQSTVSSGCSGCTIVNLNGTIPQISSGQSVPAIVAALQKDPSIKYVITCDGPFIDGLPSALAAAGLAGKIKVAGQSGDVENLTDVKAGTEAAFTGLALHYSGWLMVDAALRHLEGIAFDPNGDGGLPKQLLTTSVSFTASTSYDEPSNYPEQFKKLWLVG